jgi:serpin B
MPYVSPKGRKLAQLIFLPNDPNGLESVEKGLTAEAIQSYRKNSSMQHGVNLSLPKTKAISEFHLLPLLKEIGMPLDSIDPSKLTLNGKITDVIHKTFVSTDEKGTEAAAVTAVGLACSAPPFSENKSFIVDHSFAYLIMDGNVILFRGRIADKKPLVLDET